MIALTNSKNTENRWKDLRLNAFARRFGEAHVNLACHAAFPLALTPELLYCLRENFQKDAPWIAVADILLFLCDPVGYQLYELPGEIRHELRVYLKERFGEKRLCDSDHNLSDFMNAYIRQQLNTNKRAGMDLGTRPDWIALAYIRPKQAVHDIAEALKEALEQENPTKWVHLSSLLESYADVDPLIESGFQPLLVLARGWDAIARGQKEAAASEFNKLGQPGEQIEVEGVRFEIPQPNPPLTKLFDFQVVTVNRRGKVIKKETKQARYFTENLGNNVTLDIVAIPGGKFLMGSPDDEPERYGDESPQHEVTVPPFFMGKYPVTQAQWRAVAALPQVNRELDPDPSDFKGDNLPVETISWYEAVEFCDRISAHTKRHYRLPSEAEWEYACRAGTTTPFHFGEAITTELANYHGEYTYGSAPKGEYRQKTTSVGSFNVANAFGLFDMHGNIWEWCADHWHDNYQDAPTDSSPWIIEENTGTINEKNSQLERMLRGGSWNNNPRNCRSACRNNNDNPDNRNNNIGFRVVVSGASAALCQSRRMGIRRAC